MKLDLIITHNQNGFQTSMGCGSLVKTNHDQLKGLPKLFMIRNIDCRFLKEGAMSLFEGSIHTMLFFKHWIIYLVYHFLYIF